MLIVDLADRPAWIATLAGWHFEHLGTAHRQCDARRLSRSPGDGGAQPDGALGPHRGRRRRAARLGQSRAVRPAGAPGPDALAGPALRGARAPAAGNRGGVVGAALDRAGACGHDRVYLFTSGTLPAYYARLGWRTLEQLSYLGKERTVMDMPVTPRAMPECD